jgi:hypothetical protein
MLRVSLRRLCRHNFKIPRVQAMLGYEKEKLQIQLGTSKNCRDRFSGIEGGVDAAGF